MGDKGFHPQFTISNSITAGLTRIERARGFLEAATMSEEWIRKTIERAFVLEAHHTTHIEGTRLSLAQAQHILAGHKIPGADPDDARELLNYRQAFDLVGDYVRSGAPITEGLIREIHKRLVMGVRGGEASPGQYRKVQNYIVNSATGEAVYTPPPPHDVPPMMADFVTWLSRHGGIHPVLVSGIAQFQLVHIHPFVDGNGRTSRLLSMLCLYRAGYDFKRLFSISEYYDEDRPAFYRAIQSVREQGMDMTGWLDYFVEALAAQVQQVIRRGTDETQQDMVVRETGLSDRQSRALRRALERGSLSIRDFEALCPKVNRRTLQRDLKDMVRRQLLVVEGATNRLVYRPTKSAW